MAILVPLAIASTSWAAISFNTPIREATHSWFPEGYNVAVAPAKNKAPEEQNTTAEDESEPIAGKQNQDTTPEQSDARNRVPVNASPSPSADEGSDSSSSSSDSTDSSSDSGEQDAPEPEQPAPTPDKELPPPPTSAPTPPPNDPEPTPSDTPTSEPTEDPGDEGEEEEDGGIIDIDIVLPLPLLGAPGPEASATGTNGLVEARTPGAVPGSAIQQPTVSVSVADLVTWTYVVWQSIG